MVTVDRDSRAGGWLPILTILEGGSRAMVQGSMPSVVGVYPLPRLVLPRLFVRVCGQCGEAALSWDRGSCVVGLRAGHYNNSIIINIIIYYYYYLLINYRDIIN